MEKLYYFKETVYQNVKKWFSEKYVVTIALHQALDMILYEKNCYVITAKGCTDFCHHNTFLAL